jgi:hypothetical protein
MIKKNPCGPNTIILKVLRRNISNSIKGPLTTLFNLRLEKGQTYDIKKKISQSHTVNENKGGPQNLTNFRPISLKS